MNIIVKMNEALDRINKTIWELPVIILITWVPYWITLCLFEDPQMEYLGLLWIPILLIARMWYTDCYRKRKREKENK